MLSEKEKLDSIITLGIELNKVNDQDLLMERVLTEARRVVNADAGSIYLKENNRLKFTYTQNETLQKKLQKGKKLVYSTYSIPIDKTSIAGYVAITGKTLTVSDVYNISSEEPYKFREEFDQKTGYITKSAITLPLQTSRNNILGILQIINPRSEYNDIITFTKEDEKMMQHFASIAVIAVERALMTRAIFLRTIRMTQLHDPQETWNHVNRVGAYSVEIYEYWAYKHNISPKEINKNRDLLRMAAMLHDVGKIAISDLILKKPGRFNYDEYEIMKQHTVLGAQIFINIQSDFDEIAYQVALNHHERWDGTGYPGHIDVITGEPLEKYRRADGKAMGKKGTEIPLFGRIVAIADVYDALSSERIYKQAWSESKTLKTIQNGSNNQFDPEIVEIFFSCLNQIKAIQNRYSIEQLNDYD